MPVPAVLLINPNRMRPPVGPLGLEYLAPALRSSGFEPVLCDLAFAPDWQEALDNAIDGVGPIAVAFTIRNIDDAYFASQDFVLKQAAEMVRHVKQKKSTPVILGGVGFSTAPREILAYTGADYGVVGDGESGMPRLLQCVRENGDLRRAPGSVFRSGYTVVTVTPEPYDLSAMPPPPRRFIDNVRYFNEGGQAGLETKRGCGRPCIYCVEPIAKGRVNRQRLPDSIVAECRDLLDQGIDVIHLCDSEFNLPPQHAQAVCEALIRSGIAGSLRWYTYAYPQYFNAELAKTMARAGCVGINFGVDHGAAEMLRRLGRSYTPGDIPGVLDACKAAGITIMCDMLFGGPGETRTSIAQALDFMRSLDVDRVGLSCGVRVYPNTPLARLVRRQGPLKSNPNLHGTLENNEDLLEPIFYVSAALDGDIHAIVAELVDGDKRFLHADPARLDGNYNYNDNTVLERAIRRGERGAYWDILRRIEEQTPRDDMRDEKAATQAMRDAE